MSENAPLLAGALIGLGLILAIVGLVPSPPDLRAALDRMSGRPVVVASPIRVGSTRLARHVGGMKVRHLPHLAEQLGLTRYAADLNVVSRSAEDLAMRKVICAAIGASLPVLLASFAAVIGLALPIAIPLLVAVVLAAIGFFLPDLDLREKASDGRAEIRAVTAVYLELVALERAADAGTTEALERAATVGDGWVFERIQHALLQAELAGRPPWQGLAALGVETGVGELADLADIAELAGNDGAAVYASLRARATSLRTQILTTQTAQANAASERMVIPVSLLGIVFMVLVGYPAFVRIFTT